MKSVIMTVAFHRGVKQQLQPCHMFPMLVIHCLSGCVCCVLSWWERGQVMDDLKVQRLESSTQGQTDWHDYQSKERDGERDGEMGRR